MRSHYATVPPKSQSAHVQSLMSPMQDLAHSNFNLTENNFSPGMWGIGTGLSIRETAEEIHHFDSTFIHLVDSFIDSVCNRSESYNLIDIQTLAVAKRCLASTPKLFLNFFATINFNELFQTIFLDEFQEKFTAADIHQILSTHHLRKGEN